MFYVIERGWKTGKEPIIFGYDMGLKDCHFDQSGTNNVVFPTKAPPPPPPVIYILSHYSSTYIHTFQSYNSTLSVLIYTTVYTEIYFNGNNGNNFDGKNLDYSKSMILFHVKSANLHSIHLWISEDPKCKRDRCRSKLRSFRYD